MFRFFSELVDPYAPAEGPPPRRLLPFVRWALSGVFPVLGAAAFFGSLTGLGEILSAFLIGHIIDHALAFGATGYFAANWPLLLLAAGFYVVLRPLVMGISAALNSLAVAPNVSTLVLLRLHGLSPAAEAVVHV